MKLRKYIRETIERLFEQDAQIKGLDILYVSPFRELPETRKEVDWRNRGDAYLPSVDGYSQTHIFSKEDVMGYIRQFSSKFGEEPMFSINGNRVNVLNEPYKKFSNLSIDALTNFGTEGD